MRQNIQQINVENQQWLHLFTFTVLSYNYDVLLEYCDMFFLLFGCSDYEVNRRVLRDSYVQPGRSAGVDILWVVDSAASMFEEQDQLIAHASSFIGFCPCAYRLSNGYNNHGYEC